jgi:hypothetical protein
VFEHLENGRHAGPELRILLDAEQPDVDAPQHVLPAGLVGRVAVEQLGHAPKAPALPNLPLPGQAAPMHKN